MAEVLKGIDSILLYRLLEKETQEAAWKMAFQTEHTFKKSRSSDTVVTKDGPVISLGEIEYELTATSIASKDDSHIEEISDAIDNGSVVEIWIINKAEKGTGENADKYKAVNVRAYVTNYEPTANAEDNVEISLEFGVFGRAKKGYATLTTEQEEVVQYAFRDTTKVIKEEEGE